MGKAFSAASRLLAPLSHFWGQWRQAEPRDMGPEAPPSISVALSTIHAAAGSTEPDAATTAKSIALGQAASPNLPSATPHFSEASTMSAPEPWSAPAKAAPRAPHVSRPLKVLRIREQRQSKHHAGRLVISGRMADVCAELERLANAHPGLLH